MTKVIYLGVHDEVEVTDHEGRVHRCERDVETDVPDKLAQDLILQSSWGLAEPKNKPRKREPEV